MSTNLSEYIITDAKLMEINYWDIITFDEFFHCLHSLDLIFFLVLDENISLSISNLERLK